MELSVEAEKPPWARQLKRRGFYFEGLVDSDDVETILEGHRRDTVTSYGTRTSSKVTADDGTGDKQVAQNLQVLAIIYMLVWPIKVISNLLGKGDEVVLESHCWSSHY